MKRGKAKVTWEDVCLPKYEGGLGVRSFEMFSVALMLLHIWKLLSHKESLWVKWIHSYKLKQRNFGDVCIPSNVNWGWRKILPIRSIIQPYKSYKIRNGAKVSVWFHMWNANCPLINHMTNRAISSAGFNLRTKVADVVSTCSWSWPTAWFNMFPMFINICAPNLNDEQVDLLQWRMSDGSFKLFSVRNAWNSVRPRGNEVGWYHLVWSRHRIPRHATYLWLVMRKQLKTHDRMRQWDVSNGVDLNLLCKTQPVSDDHLFFECSYSSLPRFGFVFYKWTDIMVWLLLIFKRNNVNTIVIRLVLVAVAYFIWQERNNRVHGKGKRNPEHLSKVIVDMVD